MARQAIEITARAKAFSGENVRRHKFQVEANGDVRVWDAIAGHFTNCNSLSESAKARIRKLAKALANDEE